MRKLDPMSADKDQNTFRGGWVLLAGALFGALANSGASCAQAPVLQISSPVNGSVVRPGQALAVTVTSPNGTAFSQVAVIGPEPIDFTGQSDLGAGTIFYTDSSRHGFWDAQCEWRTRNHFVDGNGHALTESV